MERRRSEWIPRAERVVDQSRIDAAKRWDVSGDRGADECYCHSGVKTLIDDVALRSLCIWGRPVQQASGGFKKFA